MTEVEIRGLYDGYINRVLANSDGRIGHYEVAKVKRHLEDLKRTDLFFDDVAADKIVKFCSVMRLSDDDHWQQKIKLRDHQVFFFRTLMGWKKIDPHTGQEKRRFRRSLNTKGRKNGKSQENALLTGYMFAGSGERGAHCYTAANTREQALVTYDETKNMLSQYCDRNRKAKGMIRLMANSCLIPTRNNVLKAMAADPKKLDGFKPLFASVDEPHEMKTNKILKIFERGMAQKLQPLIAISSTVGYNTTYFFYKYFRMCQNILDGIMEDDSLFIDMYCMDEGDDWKDPNNWYKPNPMLGKLINLDNFTQDFKSSMNEGGSAEIDFQVKNLNEWSGTAKTWISKDKVEQSRSETDLALLVDTYVGVDLSAVKDLACTAYFQPPNAQNPKFKLKIDTFIPEVTIDARTSEDGVPYRSWANEGRFKIQKNRETQDQAIIESSILVNTEKYSYKTVNIDRWNATRFHSNLKDEGLQAEMIGQGYRDMNEPCKWLERAFIEGVIDIGDDLIFEWMLRNTAISRDPTGAMKPDKSKSSEKIDGVVAALNAIAGYLNDVKKASIYDKQGVRSVT